MKPRRFKITNANNFTGYLGTIPVEHSIATITDEMQLRILERQIFLGDFKFEEIIEPEPKPEIIESEPKTINIAEHDVEGRSGDIKPNVTINTSVKKPGRPRNNNRGRSKKQ